MRSHAGLACLLLARPHFRCILTRCLPTPNPLLCLCRLTADQQVALALRQGWVDDRKHTFHSIGDRMGGMSSECCRPRAAGVAGPGQGGRDGQGWHKGAEYGQGRGAPG